MTIAVRRERTKVRSVPGAILVSLPAATSPQSLSRAELSKARLAFRIFAAFRAHPHINNVLTHISRAKLVEVEQSLNRILDPATTSDSLSPLEQNIVDLMCAKRGITGKILKPYFQAALHRLLEPHHAERLIRHIDALFIELEWKAQQPAPSVPPPSEPSQELDNARGTPQ